MKYKLRMKYKWFLHIEQRLKRARMKDNEISKVYVFLFPQERLKWKAMKENEWIIKK